MLPTITVSPVRRACVAPVTEGWAVSSDPWDQPEEVIMKRSSKRQARRWVIQELTRCLEQRGEALRLNQVGMRIDYVALKGTGDIPRNE